MKKCSICLIKKDISSFWKDERSKDGRNSRCKDCMSLKRKSWESKAKCVFEKYKRDAKKRKIEFKMSEKDFQSFNKLVCDYCGLDLDRVRLDRIDNKVGYYIFNVVPCCVTCNNFKRSLTKEEFLRHVARIEIHQKEKQDG